MHKVIVYPLDSDYIPSCPKGTAEEPLTHTHERIDDMPATSRCRTYRQYLALRVHAVQYQRAPRHWPIPTRRVA